MQPYCIISEDLIEGILLRLSVRDLLRYRCVCKSWRAIIDQSSFILTHYHSQFAVHKTENNLPILLCRNNTYIFDDPSICYILSKQLGDDVLFNITGDLERDTKPVPNYQGSIAVDSMKCRLSHMGVANGIICLHLCYPFVQDGLVWRECFVLWNPATREFKVVPNIIAADQVIQTSFNGFGFDQLSNDFKIVACTPGDKSVAYEVYSLSTNSWKRLPYLHAYLYPSKMDACMNGVYYWTAHHRDFNDFRFYLVSLKFGTELFKVSNPPQFAGVPANCFFNNDFVPEIGLYKECLALIFTRRIPGEMVAKVDIWVATKFDDDDFGVPLEWQCLLVIKPFLNYNVGSCVRTSLMDGQLLLLNTADDDLSIDEWSLYDLETCKMKNLRIRCFDICFLSFRYVESLYPLSRTMTQT